MLFFFQSVLEWIKYDDVNLVSAEVHQLSRYQQILLVQVKEVIHLFCPLGDLSVSSHLSNFCDQKYGYITAICMGTLSVC